MRYEKPEPLHDGHIPKVKRRKTRPGAWKRAKVIKDKNGKTIIQPRHDDVLNACIDIVEAHGLPYLHVPNELYRLCSIYDPFHPDELAGVFEKSMGYQKAIRLKKILMDSFKGVIDLIVFAPIGDGINLSLQGDVKVGRDKLNHAQKAWASQNSIKQWHSIDGFMSDFNQFYSDWKNLCKELKK